MTVGELREALLCQPDETRVMIGHLQGNVMWIYVVGDIKPTMLPDSQVKGGVRGIVLSPVQYRLAEDKKEKP